jgi:hypothetical protein
MYEKSLKMFLDENKVEKENTLVVLKLPSNLRSDGEIDERDFMDRAICCVGTNSNDFKFPEYYKGR